MMTIDIEKLREDLKREVLGGFFVGGFGAALVEYSDIENATPNELLALAERFGIDLPDLCAKGLI